MTLLIAAMTFTVTSPLISPLSHFCFRGAVNDGVLPLSLSPAAENSSCNIHTEFECGNGECINYQLTCDGVAHCKDKSDEKMQYCGKRHKVPSEVFDPFPAHLRISLFAVNRSCRKGFRPCYNQRCVANSRFCDGIDDCGDNSDEAYCSSKSKLVRSPIQDILPRRAGPSHTNAHINVTS